MGTLRLRFVLVLVRLTIAEALMLGRAIVVCDDYLTESYAFL
jgi:hypothetical protein